MAWQAPQAVLHGNLLLTPFGNLRHGVVLAVGIEHQVGVRFGFLPFPHPGERDGGFVAGIVLGILTEDLLRGYPPNLRDAIEKLHSP